MDVLLTCTRSVIENIIISETMASYRQVDDLVAWGLTPWEKLLSPVYRLSVIQLSLSCWDELSFVVLGKMNGPSSGTLAV